MKVKELIAIMGDNQFPTYVFNWGTIEEIERGDGMFMKSTDLNSIIDLFGEEDLACRDAVYIEYDEEEKEPIINIWLKRESFKNTGGRVKEEEDAINNTF